MKRGQTLMLSGHGETKSSSTAVSKVWRRADETEQAKLNVTAFYLHTTPFSTSHPGSQRRRYLHSEIGRRARRPRLSRHLFLRTYFGYGVTQLTKFSSSFVATFFSLPLNQLSSNIILQTDIYIKHKKSFCCDFVFLSKLKKSCVDFRNSIIINELWLNKFD